MPSQAQSEAVRGYRRRLAERGLGRFEVLARLEDRDLIRSVAKRLSENDAEAARLRQELSGSLPEAAPSKGGILAILRRSPLVGLDLVFEREVTSGRDVDL